MSQETNPEQTTTENKTKLTEEEKLMNLTQKVLLEKVRDEFGYPASIAAKKTNKTKLVNMIMAGKYPNEIYQEKQDGLDVTFPADSRIVFGGPAIDGVVHPFGFSTEQELTVEDLEKYGVGKGVKYHSKVDNEAGTIYTYKIVY